jgi:glycosyltransferase involved in cell wall biosynthesis
MENPKVSVIIPAYNAEKTLRQCLSFVLKQTYENYEVIVVDNNSTDKTKDIIHEFRDKDNKIKYFFEPKIGRGAARYKGEINCQGDIILMTDSDCIVPNNWIEEMTRPIVTNGYATIQGTKKPIIINYWTKHIQEEEERRNIEKIKDGKIGLFDTANFAIKKSVLREVGYTNPSIASGNDIELMLRLKIKGYAIHLKQSAVLHNHPSTALKVFKKQLIRSCWQGRIRKTYKEYKKLFETVSKVGHMKYFMRLVLEILCLHENFKYDLVTGIGWRIGLFYGYFSGKKITKIT